MQHDADSFSANAVALVQESLNTGVSHIIIIYEALLVAMTA